jgi:hypothetical protein
MRTIVLKDHTINKDECLALLDEYSKFFKKHTGIKCEWYVEGYDFSRVPTTPDEDGDLKPTYKYRQGLCKEIHDRYGDYGVDNIVMLVHEDNFTFRGIWGTAWAYRHFKYNFILSRWDKKNKTNTFNTLFHELEHPHDTAIQKELGIDVVPLIANHFGDENFTDYDRDYVHGNSPEFTYIGKRGYKRDGRMLEFLAPYLRVVYQKRKDKHNNYTDMLKKVISLLTKLVDLLKKKNKV